MNLYLIKIVNNNLSNSKQQIIVAKDIKTAFHIWKYNGDIKLFNFSDLRPAKYGGFSYSINDTLEFFIDINGKYPISKPWIFNDGACP